MQNEIVFQVHYYVGPMLAVTGVLRVTGTDIVFKPTGVLEKMMDMHDVVIAMADIIAYEYVGGLLRLVRIKTSEKIHKFEGAEAGLLGDALLELLPNKATRKPSKVHSMHPHIGPKYSCANCGYVAQPGFRVCPSCRAFPKGVCEKCRCLLDTAWTYCAYCGTKTATNPASSFQTNKIL